MRESLSKFCAEIGTDPLLVQGTGGNVSWKEDNTLWIKASGLRLTRAMKEDIFVPVDMVHLKEKIRRKDFHDIPPIPKEHSHRPSIEIWFHALMPHRIVVHLHGVETLSHLVRKKCNIHIDRPYLLVDYHKPGSDLAQAIFKRMAHTPCPDIVFMKNHGIIIGADSIEKIHGIIREVEGRFQCHRLALVNIPRLDPLCFDYVPVENQLVQQLAWNPLLFKRIDKNWVLYPDHVVFLGERSSIYPEKCLNPSKDDRIIFVKNRGVFTRGRPNTIENEMLLLYYNVLSRQSPNESLNCLSSRQVKELLEWNAEHYRQKIVTESLFS